MLVPVTISIIIPTYNRLPLLQQAIASVIKQTYEDWELIVADDGSTDDTATYLHGLKDSRIKYLGLTHSGNIAHVRNKGTEAASGTYLMFLDSDDCWYPDKLAIQLQRTQEAGAQWSYTAYEHINASGETVAARSGRSTVLSGEITASLLTAEVGVSISSLLVSKKLFEQTGRFDESPLLNLREDYNLVLRLSLRATTLGIPPVLVQVREHSGRTTHTCTDAYERMAYVYSKFIRLTNDKNLQKIAHARRAKHLMAAAKLAFKQKNIRLGIRYSIEALKRVSS